jgi:hypothetical protein
MHKVTNEQMTRMTKAQKCRIIQERVGRQVRRWLRLQARMQALILHGSCLPTCGS